MKILNYNKKAETRTETKAKPWPRSKQFGQGMEAIRATLQSQAAEPRSDLRSNAREAARDVKHKAKWGQGVYPDGYPNPPYREVDGKIRPLKTRTKGNVMQDKLYDAKSVHKQALNRKLDTCGGPDATSAFGKKLARKQREVSKDGGKENDDAGVYEPLDLSNGDVKVALSTVDEANAHGESVLGAALDKAVAKYEDRKTTELVRNEYDVLDTVSEVGALETPVHEVDEDDFEFV